MNIRRRTLILISVFIIVFLLCVVEATDVNSKEQGEVREITIVTITPGHEKKEEPEPINFDLQHLAIVGKEEPDAGRNEENDKSNAEFDGEHGAGPEIAGADPVMPEEGTDGSNDDLGEDSDISGEHGFEDAGFDGTADTAGDTGSEDWGDNLPQDGASGTDTGGVEEAEGSADGSTMHELVGAESGDEAGIGEKTMIVTFLKAVNRSDCPFQLPIANQYRKNTRFEMCFLRLVSIIIYNRNHRTGSNE